MALQLYVDGSSDPNSKIGYGAMLLVDARAGLSIDELKRQVKVRHFHPCGSSSLELLGLLWALQEIGESAKGASVFTDSQTIVGLPERRESLEATNFCSRSGKLLSQANLYREFYDALDRHAFELVKLKGHQRDSEKSREAILFTLVDRASRSALRAKLGR